MLRRIVIIICCLTFFTINGNSQLNSCLHAGTCDADNDVAGSAILKVGYSDCYGNSRLKTVRCYDSSTNCKDDCSASCVLKTTDNYGYRGSMSWSEPCRDDAIVIKTYECLGCLQTACETGACSGSVRAEFELSHSRPICSSSVDWCAYPWTGCSDFTYQYNWEDTCCCDQPYTPIVVDIAGNGFDMTSGAEGVHFNFNGIGEVEKVSWTKVNSDDAFLVLDRDGNATIDNGFELFGNFTAQPDSDKPNGFLALTEYDKAENGGNRDGKVNYLDNVFVSLRLWQDINHNGISEPGELHPLPELGISSFDLEYKESKRTDEHGNQFRYRAKVTDLRGDQAGRWAWDIFLMPGRFRQQ